MEEVLAGFSYEHLRLGFSHKERIKRVLAPLKAYALTLLICAVAVPVALYFDAPSSCLMISAMASSLFLGRRAGLFAVALLALIFDYLFLVPKFHLIMTGNSVGRFVVFVGAMIFATELIDAKRRSDRSRLKREKEFRALAETCPDCILIVDEQRIIQFANQAVSRMFNYLKEDVIRKPVSLLLPDLPLDQLPSGEFMALSQNGCQFYVESTYGKFSDKITIFLRDITDRKRVQEQLASSEMNLRLTQMKLSQASQLATASELSASIVHEISQPIAAMVANGQSCLRWLAMDPPNQDNAKAAVERIVRDGKDARDIIKGLRNLFKRSEPKKSLVDLRQIVEEVLVLVHGRTEKEGIFIDVQLASDLPRMSGDPIQLQQVLLNLVSNAIDAMHAIVGRSKILVVRARQLDDSSILTEIEDSGVGISDHEKIFETFFTTKENGMGMGLAVCKTIVTSHGGRLWASPASEVGTVFSFTIPSVSRTAPISPSVDRY